MKVLILSSSMGAGHNGAGHELIRRLEAEGHEARMHDYLDALPFRIGHFVRGYYHLQLRYAPWSYENSFHTMPRLYRLLAFLNGFFSQPVLRGWMRRFPPDVVVSNNPLATLALGWQRQHGRLPVPAVTFITDFGVHPLWVHAGMDLHLAVHPQAAAEAAERSGGEARAPGPLVGQRFSTAREGRNAMRAELGLAPGERAVLVVAGSWGVGEVEETARLLLASGRYTPVTVCGTDERLRARMQGLGVVLGWTDAMPELMAAVDVLVENAGGLTSMEAFASGLPVVTFNPIPGHGRENALAMARAGVTRWPETGEQLLEVLDEVACPGPARDALTAAASAMFAGDASADVLSVAAPLAEVVPLSRAHVRSRRAVRRLAAVGAASVALYGSLTAGVAVAANYGLTVPEDAHPHRQITLVGVTRPVAYLGVRLNPSELTDPSVQAALASLGSTVIVTTHTATLAVGAIQGLAARGLEVASGGCGRAHAGVLPEQLDVSSARTIGLLTGVRPSAFVPARPVDALDLLWAGRRHVTIVVAHHTVDSERLPTKLLPGESYVLDGRADTPAVLLGALNGLASEARAQGTVLAGLKAFE